RSPAQACYRPEVGGEVTKRASGGGGGGGEGKAMRSTKWIWLVIGLWLIGCASTATPTLTVAPSPTPVPTATPSPSPTATIAPTSTSPAPTAMPTAAPSGVTVTILYDNNVSDPRLETAWGFSCLVEGLEKTILFDTGGDASLLLRNMRALGIDPQNVDVVVISHIHNDHLGGLAGFLKENPAVTVYLPQSFPENIKSATREAGAEVVAVHGPVEICEHALSTGELGDSIQEQSLVLETAQGLVVITGCAHPGVVNIVRRAQKLSDEEVALVLGGFHLGGASEAKIVSIVEDFRRLGVRRVAPCHCSGDVARRLFGETYGEDFIPAGVGNRLEIRD
ncbi:MAG: MBL fold metallo-hydrolase, partial [Anaerolineae bacterium]|nr:MBL fold metallo-hydrolase [Anaerolineae bacterium]